MSGASQIRSVGHILSRLLAAGLLLPVLMAGPSSAGNMASILPKVVMLGDSVTAGYGLGAADALPAQLQAAMGKIGRPVQVIAAGVSGDTTADGLARADFSVPAGTDLCLVELGGNDLLQGVDPAVVRKNLTAILAKLKARHIPVLLVGLKAPPSIGAGYAKDFDAAFLAASKTAGVGLYPNWISTDPTLRQADGIHPNPRGVRAIAASLAPYVAKALPKRS